MSKHLPLNLFIRQALLYPLTFPFLPPVDKVEEGHKYAAGRLTGTLETPPAYGLPKTGQTTSYRTGDDGDLEIGKPDAPPRFTDNNDGTITDNGSGLMWVKEPGAIGGDWGSAGDPSTMTWNDAIDNCLALDYAGHDDWRLPNFIELCSIIKFEVHNPCIDATFFPDTKPLPYWTSTFMADTPTKKWYIRFNEPYFYDLFSGNAQYVRPVRGPI